MFLMHTMSLPKGNLSWSFKGLKWPCGMNGLTHSYLWRSWHGTPQFNSFLNRRDRYEALWHMSFNYRFGSCPECYNYWRECWCDFNVCEICKNVFGCQCEKFGLDIASVDIESERENRDNQDNFQVMVFNTENNNFLGRLA